MPFLTREVPKHLEDTLKKIINIRKILIENAEILGFTSEQQELIKLLQTQAARFIKALKANPTKLVNTLINTNNENSPTIKLFKEINDFLEQTHVLMQLGFQMAYKRLSSDPEANKPIIDQLMSGIKQLFSSTKTTKETVQHLLNAGLRLKQDHITKPLPFKHILTSLSENLSTLINKSSKIMKFVGIVNVVGKSIAPIFKPAFNGLFDLHKSYAAKLLKEKKGHPKKHSHLKKR